jgi:4-hydroxythreonine-4-phosphate dehydrogenase
MQEIEPRPLAVSGGDPAGIGLDIALTAWTRRAQLSLPRFVLFASVDACAERAAKLGLDVRLQVIEVISAAAKIRADALPIIHIPQATTTRPGAPDPRNGAAVIAAIEAATAAVVGGDAAALVTNPIAKNVLYAAGFEHPGHTEFLAALATKYWPRRQHTAVMMLSCDELRVVPLTIHVPLAAVPALITQALIVDVARMTHQALIEDFGFSNPRIAVAGLNPHAGEMGSIGREDVDVIHPAVNALKSEGMRVTGPHSADTLFHDAARANYDAVIAMYHDQALIPIKTLAFDRGVNITLGLPFVRTSPDHGTAFDIAGSGKARPDSFIAALRLAEEVAKRRRATAI